MVDDVHPVVVDGVHAAVVVDVHAVVVDEVLAVVVDDIYAVVVDVFHAVVVDGVHAVLPEHHRPAGDPPLLPLPHPQHHLFRVLHRQEDIQNIHIISKPQ